MPCPYGLTSVESCERMKELGKCRETNCKSHQLMVAAKLPVKNHLEFAQVLSSQLFTDLANIYNNTFQVDLDVLLECSFQLHFQIHVIYQQLKAARYGSKKEES